MLHEDKSSTKGDIPLAMVLPSLPPPPVNIILEQAVESTIKHSSDHYSNRPVNLSDPIHYILSDFTRSISSIDFASPAVLHVTNHLHGFSSIV